MTGDELLANIERDRAMLDALIADIDAETRVKPLFDGGRSVKDVLAHITAWEQHCISKIRDDHANAGADAGTAEEGVAEDAVDRFNEAIFAANRERAWDDVAAAAAQSYAEMLATVQLLDDGDMSRIVHWEAGEGPAMWEFISWDSDHHYRDHIAQIRPWQAAESRA